MRNALAIARKELSIYFTTPWAYVVFTIMIAVTAFFFMAALSAFQEIQDAARFVGWDRMGPYKDYRNLTTGVIVPLWHVILFLTVLIAPLLSMRLFSEEKRNKTFELLMTTPLRPSEIVLGKYLGGVGVIGTTLGLTIAFPLILQVLGVAPQGQPVLEWSTVLLGYFGMLLWGAACIAVGMFISALTESQMIAALLTWAVLLVWWALSLLNRIAEPWRSVVNYLSFNLQLQNLTKGVLDVKALVFFASVIVFGLLLTHRTVEAQRWA